MKEYEPKQIDFIRLPIFLISILKHYDLKQSQSVSDTMNAIHIIPPNPPQKKKFLKIYKRLQKNFTNLQNWHC